MRKRCELGRFDFAKIILDIFQKCDTVDMLEFRSKQLVDIIQGQEEFIKKYFRNRSITHHLESNNS